MDLLKLITERRSVRHYLPATVEQEKMDYLMECARLAPSAANFQPLALWHRIQTINRKTT